MKGAQTIVVAMALDNFDHDKNTNNSSSDCTKWPQPQKKQQHWWH